jgi:xylose dehydrogenase (NAD/NADP)
MRGPIRWGLLSTAGIGRLVIEATQSRSAQGGAGHGSGRARFTAVASRDAARAAAFAASAGLTTSHGTYEELIASDEIDAVYVALPNAMHTAWTIRALQAGKHVLCEKPFAATADDAARCFDAADAAGVLCTEGFMYRMHPQTSLAHSLVAGGAIGDLTYVRAALRTTVGPGDIRRSVALGGGALADLGCYCVSAIRLFAGEPIRVSADLVRDGTDGDGVDVRFAASMRLAGDVLAGFDCGLDQPRADELELIGTTGRIVVPDPWLCRQGYVDLHRAGVTERLPADPAGVHGDADPYRLEFEAFSAACLGEASPVFGRDDAVAQAATLEALMTAATQKRAT